MTIRDTVRRPLAPVTARKTLRVLANPGGSLFRTENPGALTSLSYFLKFAGFGPIPTGLKR
jgi:hypothetical protein